jgi:hypothetical protein
MKVSDRRLYSFFQSRDLIPCAEWLIHPSLHLSPIGDQIIEWNGVNLCNRSDGEVQQILFSQFSDDEVEIIYLNRDKFYEAYGGDHERPPLFGRDQQNNLFEINDTFDSFSSINKLSSKKNRPSGRGSLFMR